MADMLRQDQCLKQEEKKADLEGGALRPEMSWNSSALLHVIMLR